MRKELLAELKCAIFKSWLKIHPKQSKCLKPEANPSFWGVVALGGLRIFVQEPKMTKMARKC